MIPNRHFLQSLPPNFRHIWYPKGLDDETVRERRFTYRIVHKQRFYGFVAHKHSNFSERLVFHLAMLSISSAIQNRLDPGAWIYFFW